MEEDHVRLLIRETTWEVIRQAREDDAARMKAAAYEGMKAYFNEHKIDPEHWIFLRLQLKEREESWSVIKRTAINLLLVGALTFGGISLWEKATSMILASDHRNGQQRAEPTTDGP